MSVNYETKWMVLSREDKFRNFIPTDNILYTLHSSKSIQLIFFHEKFKLTMKSDSTYTALGKILLQG